MCFHGNWMINKLSMWEVLCDDSIHCTENQSEKSVTNPGSELDQLRKSEFTVIAKNDMKDFVFQKVSISCLSCVFFVFWVGGGLANSLVGPPAEGWRLPKKIIDLALLMVKVPFRMRPTCRSRLSGYIEEMYITSVKHHISIDRINTCDYTRWMEISPVSCAQCINLSLLICLSTWLFHNRVFLELPFLTYLSFMS